MDFRLASGRDADVFASGSDRVLRRYRNGGDVAEEAAIMHHVAQLGFPVPTVYAANGADLVMDLVGGPTMLQALISGDLDLEAGGALLADLHDRLHQLPPRRTADPSFRVLHLDLHPDNVMMGHAGPVVIDWRNAREGPPELDVALSALILGEVAVDEAHPVAAMAVVLLRTFVRAVGRDSLLMLDEALAMRRVDPALSDEEVARLGAAARMVRNC